jgi:DNA invertase Pin-like site-specific DNA recombinase|tara:strand:- start:1477 stop:2178 length:702 start_codon:yes stop_codon:yes gene_type:complete
MPEHSGKYVAYYRVSTKRQGDTGYGLEAQRERVEQHLNGGDWQLIAEFTETESGKRSTDRHRHELRKALELCADEGATLVVAKLDRLTRNLPFLTRIIESGVKMIACDVPTMSNANQNRFVLQLMANIAELEGAVISERTRDALATAKKKGAKLGNPRPKAASRLASKQLTADADAFAMKVGRIIEELEEYGCVTLEQIAKGLEARGVKTARGNKSWALSSVANIRRRYRSKK